MSRTIILSLFFLSLCFITGCQSLLFFPSKQLVRTPADIDIAYRDIYISNNNQPTLHGWWLPSVSTKKAKGTIYFLHGNAENISTHLASVYWLPEQGYQVFLLDYRGYGRSEGSPELPTVLDDIERGINWLQQQPETQGSPLIMLGQSLGAALGGYTVASKPELLRVFDAIVLDAAFASYPMIAKEVAANNGVTWLLQRPIAASMPKQYDLIDHIGRIQPTPLLLIHGQQDQIIAPHHSELLFQKAGEPKYILRYTGSHIDTFMHEENRAYLLDFMRQVTHTK